MKNSTPSAFCIAIKRVKNIVSQMESFDFDRVISLEVILNVMQK